MNGRSESGVVPANETRGAASAGQSHRKNNLEGLCRGNGGQGKCYERRDRVCVQSGGPRAGECSLSSD